jgi:hypothetical protein
MSEAIHEVAHEASHNAAHSGQSHQKLIGLLISVLALVLAMSEMQGKSAQTHGLTLNIQSSDLWNFFQAKTIRQTVVRSLAENAKIAPSNDAAAAQKQIDAWTATAGRWESEPSTNEGRQELLKRAKAAEEQRDHYLEKYHAYELASLVLQLGIVLASVALLSSLMAFAFASLALGGLGIIMVAGTYLDIHAITGLLHKLAG